STKALPRRSIATDRQSRQLARSVPPLHRLDRLHVSVGSACGSGLRMEGVANLRRRQLAAWAIYFRRRDVWVATSSAKRASMSAKLLLAGFERPAAADNASPSPVGPGPPGPKALR